MKLSSLLQKKYFLFLLPAMLCSAISLSGQNWELKQKLGSTDQEPGDNLGISVAISGNYMIAGAWWEERPGTPEEGLTSAGAAYIYKKNQDGNWVQTQKLESPYREILGYYGFQVAMHGDYAMVGAFNEDHSGAFNVGRVYAYHRNANDHWVLDDSLKVTPHNNNEYFGVSVAMTGDYALIGADSYDFDENGANEMSDAGAAFLFKRDENNHWTQVRQFVAPDRNTADQFGRYLDLNDDGFVIGAFHKDQGLGEFQMGAAYAVYCDDTSCGMDQVTSEDLQKLVASDQNNFELFGWDVAISGKWIVCGKNGESDQPGGNFGSNAGAAYFFHWENSQWVQKQKVYASDVSAFAKFGRAVAMDGPVCVIGAGGESEDANGQHTVSGAGAMYVFELQSNNTWMAVEKLVGTNRSIGDLLGEDAVDVSGSSVAGGAWLADTLTGNAIIDGGAVYVFERDSPITATRDLLKLNHAIVLSNPSLDGKLLLQFTAESTIPVTLQVHSMHGERLLQEKTIQGQRYQADLSRLPSGVYFVQVSRPGYLPEVLRWIRL